MSRGTEGLLTRRWRKPDSNPRSHSWKPEDYVERAARRSMSVLRGDRGFESGFLQRGVDCEPGFRGPIPPTVAAPCAEFHGRCVEAEIADAARVHVELVGIFKSESRRRGDGRG